MGRLDIGSGAVIALSACLLGCSGLWFSGGPRVKREVSFRLTYTFTGEGDTRWARVVALVPRTIPGRQVVRQVNYSLEPLRVFELGGNRYAEFFFNKPDRKFKVEVVGTARLFRYDLSVARRRGRPSEAGELKEYLMAEPCLEADDPAITQAANGLNGKDEIETIRRLYDFVMQHMTFGGFDRGTTGGGAVRALRQRKGDCTDYADLMVALCRAKGIPARHVLGLYVTPSVADRQHSWVEVHTRTYGWVPLDPTVDDCTDNASFERLPPRYLRFSAVRNDELLDNRNSYALFRWWGDPITLEDRYEVTWQETVE